MDIDTIPDFLGGYNDCLSIYRNRGKGPWDDYEVVDGDSPDDIVGIRRKGSGPNGVIFTPLD